MRLDQGELDTLANATEFVACTYQPRARYQKAAFPDLNAAIEAARYMAATATNGRPALIYALRGTRQAAIMTIAKGAVMPIKWHIVEHDAGSRIVMVHGYPHEGTFKKALQKFSSARTRIVPILERADLLLLKGNELLTLHNFLVPKPIKEFTGDHAANINDVWNLLTPKQENDMTEVELTAEQKTTNRQAIKDAAAAAKAETKANKDAATKAAKDGKAIAKAQADKDKTDRDAATATAKAEKKRLADEAKAAKPTAPTEEEKAAAKAAKEAAKAEKKRLADEAKVPKGPRALKVDGAVYQIKALVLADPTIGNEAILAALLAKGIVTTLPTVATFRQDFIHSLRFLAANGHTFAGIVA